MGKRSFFITITFVAFIILGSVFLSCKPDMETEENAVTRLGRYLFYDRRLSVNNSKACATCHNPDFAFTDGYKRSLGVFADLHQRNTQPLFNLSSFKYLTAADSTIHFTLQQMDNPLFNEHPKEMGVKGFEIEILKRINEDKMYQELFAKAFTSDKDIITWEHIKKSISQFINSIVSDRSAYDKYIAGDKKALSSSQQNGMQLFFSDRLKCSSCHGGFNFSSSSMADEKRGTMHYFNTGLYDVDGKGSYPAYDQGLYQLTGKIEDMGKYRVPTLRNLAFTGPYLHDGTAATLNEVIDIYAAGGRAIHTGVNAGNGIKNLYKHPSIKGFVISENEKRDLIGFLEALTDSALIRDARYANPFVEDETKKKY